MINEILLVIFSFLIVLYSTWIVLFFFPRKVGGSLDEFPSLSIVIPAYNEEEHIEQTIMSVLSAEYPGEREIIVVDDGSKDRTGEIVGEMVKGNKIVKVVKENHRGKANAINRGVDISSGEIIVVLDADSMLDRSALVDIVKPFGNENVGAVSGFIRAVSNKNPLVWFQDFEYVLTSAWRYVSNNINSTYILPGFAALRKDALKKIGGFRSNTLAEDFEVGLRLRKAGYDLTITNATMYTNVPQNMKALARQRIRWGRGTLQVIKVHSDVPLNIKYGTVGLYGIPTQLYWFIHGFIAIPITFYQIVDGYMLYFSNINFISFPVLKYFFSWFSAFGILEYSYKVYLGEWTATYLFPFIVITFVLNITYNLLAIFKISKLTWKHILTIFFFFPYSIFVLSCYTFPLVYELGPLRKSEKDINVWEKGNGSRG